MNAKKFALVFFIAFVALVSLFFSLNYPVLAHPVTVDAGITDWPMAAPGQVNLGHIGRNVDHQGEYIWWDNPGDERTDFASPDPRVDLLEFRVTADPANLYFMAVMSDINQASGDGAPMIQIALDLDRDATGNLSFGGNATTTVSSQAGWEYLVTTRFGSSNASLRIWDESLTASYTGMANISNANEVIEGSIPWTALGFTQVPTLPIRFTVATFRANGSDDIWWPGDGNGALDAITNYGDPGSTANTWSEVSDGVVNYYFDLFFEPDGDVYPPLLVSAVLYDPSGAEPGSEFIEIYNASPVAINLSNFKIGDEGTIGQGEGMRQFTSGSIAPGQVIIWANNADTFTTTYGFLPDYAQNNTGYPAVIQTPTYATWAGGTISLNNDGDEVVLLDGSDTAIDVVAYEYGSAGIGEDAWPGLSNADFAVNDGQSMERAPVNWDTNDITLDFMMRPNDGTPGRFIRSTDLILVKTSADGNDDAFQYNERVTYTIVVSNSSAISLTNVTITDIVPLGAAQYVPGSIAGGDTQSDAGNPVLRWTIDSLEPATPVMLTFAMTNNQVISGTEIVNTAWATSTEIYLPVSTTITDTVVTSDLSIAKYADPEPGVAGESITYTIVISNIGAYTATGVMLTDTLHPSTTLQTVNQRDAYAVDFAVGTHNNTRWNDDRPQVDEWLELVDTSLSGDYTSRVFDAGQIAVWDTLAWRPRRPYWKPLPDNSGAEWGYDDGNVDMWGNRLLLHLDEATAPFADTSGTGLTVACTTCPAAGADGRFNDAVTFDGVDDVLVISDTVNPIRYAVELWVYPTAVTTSSLILRTDTLSGTEYHYSHMLGIVGDRFFHMVNDGGERWAIGTTTIVPNTWYHLVGTAESGGDLRLYVNGVQEAHVADLGALWAGGNEYRIGSSYGISDTSFFAGRIDEAAVYTRALASSEVLAHYLRGAQRAMFEVRSCDDPNCVGESLTGNYSEQTNSSLTIPEIDITVPANRYFQYRVTLETDHTDYGPQIEWVQVAPAHYVVNTTQGSYATATDGRAFTCTLGTLAPGAVATVTAWVDIARNFTGTITNTVWVTAVSDFDPADNTAWVTSTVESHVDINVYKYDEYWVDNETFVGGDPVNPGYPVTYTIVAYNAGPSDAWDVTITDTLPVTITAVTVPGGWADCGWTTFALTCTAPRLPYDAWRRIMVEAIAPPVTGTITNTAWISAESSLVLATSHLSDTEVTTIWPLADLSIAKAAEPSPAYPGETITYTLTITNAGPSDVPTPVVVDEFLSGEQVYASIMSGWTCMTSTLSRIECAYSGILAAGSSASLQITTTAPLTGVVDNRALGADWLGNTTDPNLDNNMVYLHTAVLPMADLVVTKTVVSDTVLAGAPLTYTVAISNAGPAAAGAADHTLELQSLHGQDWSGRNRAVPYHSIIHLNGLEGLIENLTVTIHYIDDPYPADLRLLLVGPNGQAVLLMANAGGGTDIEDLVLTLNDAGQLMPISDTLTSVVYRPTNHGFGGDLPLPAPAGPYGGNLGAFVGSDPNGQWRLYVYDAVADAGGYFESWMLTLTTRTTDTVTLEDVLPSGMSGTTFSGHPTDWDCAVSAENVTCQFDILPLGGPTVVTLTATAPITPGVITNTAWITSTTLDPITDSNTAWVTTTVIAVADLEIVKAVEPAGAVGAGAPLTYTLTISNNGPGLAVGPIVVTDLLPIELTAVVADGAGWNCDLAAPPLITCTLSSNLAAGDVSVLTLAATAPITPGLVLTNTAGVSAAVFDPITTNNTSAITVTVVPQANLAVVKTVQPALAQPGGSLTYTIVVTNHGPNVATNVTVTDQIENAAALGNPSGASCVRVGDAFTCTFASLDALSGATIVVTATAPAGSGLVTNTAWITSTEADLQLEDNQSIVTAVVTLPPVADAGTNQTVYVGEPVTLNGTGSTDPDNNLPLGYGWQQTGGPAVTLSNPAAAQPTFVAPATPTVLTFTLRVTDALGMPSAAPDVVVITVVDRSISGLQAFNDSPTILGNNTALWATVVTGTNITYQWAFGDGQAGVGNSVTHIYPAEGWYTAIVTASNSANSVSATTLVSITKSPTTTIYLPIVMRNYAVAPDLVVEQIVASANNVRVVVRNIGPQAIERAFANEFWVDLYINPTTPPTAVNQTWQHVGSRGVVWGVTQDALPLQPGQAITLTVTPAGGLYYRADLSSIVWPLAAGTSIYAQVDSAHTATTYGAIRENHEIVSAPYNNITGPVLSAAEVDEYDLSPVDEHSGFSEYLPPRP